MSARRVRVAHVIQNLNYGGMEKLLADIVRTMDPARFESHVVTLVYVGRYAREMEGSAQVHLCPPMSRLSLVRPATLARCFAGIGPDIVHTHSGVWYKSARAARMAGVPALVHTEHGKQGEDWFSRWSDRQAARRTDAVVAVSGALRDYLTGRLAMPADALHVIINGVDVRRFAPQPASGALRRDLGLGADQPIVGSIGRLEPVKGYEVVIRAFAEVRAAGGPPPVLVVGGEGSARADLERLVAELGLKDRVFLLGWRDDAENLLAHFRCFVMGSWSEGTSVSLLEAMAFGLPPVVTAVGGNPAVLGDALAGQAVPAGDAPALARLIERALDPAQAADVGVRARARVAGAFNLETMVSSYERLYESLLNRA